MFPDSMAHKMRKRGRGNQKGFEEVRNKENGCNEKRVAKWRSAAGYDNYYVCHFLLKNIDFKKA